MAKLKALFHGQEIANIDLVAGQEYLIGRGSNCNIQLPNEKGISRQHLKLSLQAEAWVIELVSKTGVLILEGDEVSAIELSGDCRFSVPPFEFVFESQLAQTAEQPAEIEMTEEPLPEEEFQDSQLVPGDEAVNTHEQTASSLENLDLDNEPSEIIPDDTNAEELSESTAAGVVNLIPMLKVLNEKTGEEFTLELDGQIWTAGRHPDCEIHIPENAISRKHFEISLVGNSYAIKDLGSSNGTHVNGKSLETNELHELSSGDKITVRHISMLFEVRDKNYEQKLAGIKELATIEPSISHVSDAPGAMEVYQGPAVIKMEAPEHDGGFLANPKVKKALMFGAPILLVIAIFAGGGEDKKDLGSNKPGKPVTTEKDLKEADHLLGVARNHYQNQNFSFCVTQLQKLHKIVPSYEDSKEMENLCKQAIELEREQADRVAIENNRQEVQNRIQNTIDNCESTKTETTSSADMQICLQSVFELSPEEPRALELIAEIENKEAAAINAQQNKMAREARIRNGKAAYAKAVRLEKQKKFKQAKSQYLKFIRGSYGLRSEEAKARRAIASIDKNIAAQVLGSVKACEKFLAEAKYKEAINKCNSALKIDKNNAKAIAAKRTVLKKLRIDMKKVWDSSVLEESFGNLEAAKSRWKEIVQKSVPRENYYEKAKNKLKSYGIE